MTSTTLTTTTVVGSGHDCAAPHRTAPVTVQPVSTKDDRADWARHVEGAPGGTLFHHPAWCDAVAATFGHRPHHLLARRGEAVAGVLPLLEVNSPLAGRLLISVPYGNAGGVLADDEEARVALAARGTELTGECGARVLELRSVTAAIPSFEPITGYVGFVRPLPESAEAIDRFLPRKARAAMRHARDRDGVIVRHDRAQAQLVWNLYCRSMRRLASLNYPWRLFEELLARLDERVWVTVAWLNNQPVCGTISFVFGDTVMPYIVGADERIRCDGAANLMYLSVVERAVRSGLRRYDFGRSRADNTGAAGFKKNQGFTPQPLGYQRYVPVGSTAPELKPSNPRFALARRIWPRLPLVATRSLGVWLSRWIPG